MDLVKCAICSFGVTSNAEKILYNKIMKYNQDNPNGRVQIHSHSGGAFPTKNALYKFPRELQQKINYVSIAPGILIPKEICKTTIQCAFPNDIVPILACLRNPSLRDNITYINSIDNSFSNSHAYNTPEFQRISWREINYFKTSLGNPQ